MGHDVAHDKEVRDEVAAQPPRKAAGQHVGGMKKATSPAGRRGSDARQVDVVEAEVEGAVPHGDNADGPCAATTAIAVAGMATSGRSGRPPVYATSAHGVGRSSTIVSRHHHHQLAQSEGTSKRKRSEAAEAEEEEAQQSSQLAHGVQLFSVDNNAEEEEEEEEEKGATVPTQRVSNVGVQPVTVASSMLITSVSASSTATSSALHRSPHGASPEKGQEEEEEEQQQQQQQEEEVDEYAAASYDPYEYIRHLPPRTSVPSYEHRVLLPPLLLKHHKKPTLVLDLDETLVHSTIEPPPPGSPSPDHVFSVTLENITYNVFVRVRPNMHLFLAEVAKLFEIVIFTASQEAYAGRLLDMLDTERHICHRLYRDACVFVDGNFVKDLDMLGRDLRRTMIVDNSPLAFAYHLDNGIPIESWFGERTDNHLLDLVPFLRELARSDDVRPLIRKKFARLQNRAF